MSPLPVGSDPRGVPLVRRAVGMIFTLSVTCFAACGSDGLCEENFVEVTFPGFTREDLAEVTVHSDPADAIVDQCSCPYGGVQPCSAETCLIYWRGAPPDEVTVRATIRGVVREQTVEPRRCKRTSVVFRE